MKKRFNYYILLLFMSLSLISIGFASWSITSPNPTQDTSSTGLVTSEGVVNARSIIETHIESFRYFNTCFVDKDENNKYTKPSDIGYITITVKVKENNTSIENPVLNLSIYQNSTLKTNGTGVAEGLLSKKYINSVTLKKTIGESTTNPTINPTYSETMISLSYQFDNTNESKVIEQQTLTFIIEYDLNKMNYKTAFFNTLMNYDVTFSTLSIIGGN